MSYNITEALRELRESEREDWEIWDDEVLFPAINEINNEKGINLASESNGQFGEVLTIFHDADEDDLELSGVIFKKGDYDLDDGEWNDDETEKFYQTLNILDCENKFKTKEELKNYILDKLIILD